VASSSVHTRHVTNRGFCPPLNRPFHNAHPASEQQVCNSFKAAQVSQVSLSSSAPFFFSAALPTTLKKHLNTLESLQLFFPPALFRRVASSSPISSPGCPPLSTSGFTTRRTSLGSSRKNYSWGCWSSSSSASASACSGSCTTSGTTWCARARRTCTRSTSATRSSTPSLGRLRGPWRPPRRCCGRPTCEGLD
jgi:hypothetical protein